ncbi:T9SS type A sorting domain-containing protein [Lewinella sp. 4G2]|uniref:T9SS type A sorting domain-containing protein n=1 Tax=Lewinella sp. 4G2 TaxID=1803372 RepID=UPI0007B4A5A1|nr:T9SS type A sorting domain-containing protein [Lewinella sp. 4G2]OAV43613.1 hypothetical protein A3850_003480 [Lewinella sp. 4G2]
MQKLYLQLLSLLLVIGAGSLRAQDVSANYFQGDTLVEISQSSSAATVTTFTYDTDCEQLQIAITDPVNAPQGTSKPYVVRVRNADGDQITDLTDRLTVTMRVRSAEAMPVEMLFRSGDGTADFRTSRLGFDVPAGLDEWTEATVTFTSAEFGPSFDPADIRDFWFYLDRSNENFPGNDFYIDHIVIGGPADAAQNSPCELGDGGGGTMTDTMFSANYFRGDTLVEISQSSSAASVSTFTYDTECEQLQIAITDPVNAPQGTSKPYVVRVNDADGNKVTNLTDRLTVTMRVRSAEALPVEMLFRSGDGTADFRTSRLGFDVPAGLDEWTEATVTFTSAEFGSSFDPADIRDFWFYLDRSNENFPGNDFYIDHIVIGGPADATQNSPCELGDGGGGTMTDTMFSANYFQGDTLIELSQSGSAPSVTTFTYDTDCEQLLIAITDPVGAPQGTSKPYSVRLNDADGNKVTNLTDRLTVTMRVRSAEALPVELLFRSGDGTADFRTSRLGFDVPAGLDEWTEATVTFTSDEFGPVFDPADIRDLWFYLDRSNENFPGNEFYIDHIVVGGAPDAEQNSPCSLEAGVPGTFVEYFTGDSLTSFSTSNAAGRSATFDLDTDCGVLNLSVTDPVDNALPAFNAFQVNPTNENGERLTMIDGDLSVTMRVRSAEAVNVAILLRSGGGTPPERTDRLAVDIPAGLEDWTEFTVTFTAAELGGFDPMTFSDVWFYLDRGTPNFAGNFFSIDHIAIGEAPDPAQNTSCDFMIRPTSYTAQFDNLDGLTVFGGAEAERLTIGVTADCEEALVTVTDPVNAPLGAFRPLIITPTAEGGLPITSIEGLTQVFIRARSAEAFPISVLFRSGDGAIASRSAVLTETVQGDLTGWSNLVFDFTAEDLEGFDPTDLLDMWIYLDREQDNFPGNEIFFDYISIGTKPAAEDASPCGLPDLTVGTNEAAWAVGMSVYPNPVTDLLTVDVPALAGRNAGAQLELVDVTGRLQRLPAVQFNAGRAVLSLSHLPRGVYFLRLRDAAGATVTRRLIRN